MKSIFVQGYDKENVRTIKSPFEGGEQMAKDDYHVIVYQILAYLYQCVKNGNDVDVRLLQYDSPLIGAKNAKYWSYIIANMYDYDLITGVQFAELDGAHGKVPIDVGECQITPIGIEYLCDNSFMEKAKKFLKDIKEITPFI